MTMRLSYKKKSVQDCLWLRVQSKVNVAALPELTKFMSKCKLSNNTTINLMLD